MTTISEVKSPLHQYKIVAFTPDGKALTVKDYKRDIDEARDQIKQGESISQEELEKRSKNW